MISKEELIKIKNLLEMLRIKCKTDPLYYNTVKGIEIIERELKEQEQYATNGTEVKARS